MRYPLFKRGGLGLTSIKGLLPNPSRNDVTYSDAYIGFHASDMMLNIDSDAAYLVAPKSRSISAG